MTSASKDRGGAAPVTLEELRAARTDYRDVPCEGLGGKEVRIYALSGTARAKLMTSTLGLAQLATDDDALAKLPPEQAEQVFMFQARVVAASMGFPEDQWDSVSDVLGGPTISQLFDVASDLSGLNEASQDEAVQRLRPVRNVASGTA